MLNASESIIIGVISGILTSFVVWVTVNIFNKLIIPWYQVSIYQGIKVGGIWYGFFNSNISREIEDADMEVFLDQNGSAIFGEIVIKKNLNRVKEPKILSFEGVLKDGNMVLTYKAKDSSRLGLGSYVMKLQNDGRDFRGKSLYISSNDGSVADIEILWKRKGN